MLMSTGKVGIFIRSLARRLGLPKFYFFLRRTLGVPEDHEAAVHKEIENNVRPGDVVWDVGANVGLYTEFFSEKVGRAGKGSCLRAGSRVLRRTLAENGKEAERSLRGHRAGRP